LPSVEFAAHGEAGFGGGRRDQFDDDPVADERLGAPVLSDEREEPAFDFVPLAGAGRQVADHDIEAEFRWLTSAARVSIAAPARRCCRPHRRDQQSGGVRIARPTDSLPPLTDAVHREARRVMVNPDTDPPEIGRKVADAVGYRAAQFLD
jgi:hypothetical protein